jgi:hypothetical protein
MEKAVAAALRQIKTRLADSGDAAAGTVVIIRVVDWFNTDPVPDPSYNITFEDNFFLKFF